MRGAYYPLTLQGGKSWPRGLDEARCRERMEMLGVAKQVPYEDWKAQHDAKMTKEVRDLMVSARFLTHGHVSVAGLVTCPVYLYALVLSFETND